MIRRRTVAGDMAAMERLNRRLERERRAQRLDFELAHAEGLHDEIPREFCPECDSQRTR